VVAVESLGMHARWSTARLEAFSDGVLAIAATLLVLELSVPPADFGNLWRGIAHQWPAYLAYVTSFVTIGGIWFAHHGLFRRLAQADGIVTKLNLLLLMLVSFLPFPTKLVAEAFDNTSSERAAVIFYGLALLSVNAVVSVLWRYIAAHRELLEPDVTDAEVATITRETTPGMAFYVGVILLAALAPHVAAFGYLVIAVLAVMRSRGDRTTAPA
jgi:uncharacterized membrane protein